VTEEMEQEYEAMQGRLKSNAMSLQPIGFIAPGMLHGRGPKGEG
jgi:transitional endoplasmic reticulum ATPase